MVVIRCPCYHILADVGRFAEADGDPHGDPFGSMDNARALAALRKCLVAERRIAQVEAARA